MIPEVTVAMPIFNASGTIKAVLDKLTYQKIPNLEVLMMDNGSTDGTIGLLSELCARNYYLHKKAQDRNNLLLKYFIGIHDHTKHPYENAQMTRKILARQVKTEFVFFLDTDVILPPFSIPRMLEAFKEEENIGELGMRYEPDSAHQHVMLGATLWRTKTFLDLPEFTKEHLSMGCDCNFAVKEVEKMGMKSLHYPHLQAYHCKHF